MSSQGPLPYLMFSGVEIANSARTYEYLRHGLADTQQGHWELGEGGLCDVLYRLDAPVAVDVDAPVYGVPAYGGAAYAGGGGTTPFLSPVADPAPWYDPTEPGSSDLLGFALLGLTGYDSTIQRPVTQRLNGLQGGVFSRQERIPRVWRFRAAMISASDAGAEYGLRWLTAALEQNDCVPCQTGSVVVRLVCPPDDGSDDSIGEWTSYSAVLTDGPHEVEQWSPSEQTDVLAGCRDFVILEWEITAGNPFLYKRPMDVLSDTIVGVNGTCTDICDWLFGNPGTPHCVGVTPPTRGTVGAIFTISSVSGMGALRLEGSAQCPQRVTVGHPEQGASIFTNFQGYTATSKYALGLPGKVSLLAQTLWMEVATVPAICQALIYSDAAGVPGVLLAASDEITVPVTSGPTKVTFPFTEGKTLDPAANHWLAYRFVSANEVDIVCVDSTAGGYKIKHSTTVTDPFGTTSAGAGGVLSAALFYETPVIDPPLLMELSGIEAGTTVTVDCAQHTIEIENADGTIADGLGIVVLEGRSIEWIEWNDCDDITCVCVRSSHPCSNGGDTTVSIQTQAREG